MQGTTWKVEWNTHSHHDAFNKQSSGTKKQHDTVHEQQRKMDSKALIHMQQACIKYSHTSEPLLSRKLPTVYGNVVKSCANDKPAAFIVNNNNNNFYYA